MGIFFYIVILTKKISITQRSGRLHVQFISISLT